MTKLFMSLGMILALTGCAANPTRFRDDGLYHDKFDYSIVFSDPDNRVFIGDEWYIDNYQYLEREKKFERKKGAAYSGRVYVDRNDDGSPERERAFFCDLELRHRRNNGMIWISTTELPKKFNETHLDVFLRNYIESLAGAIRVRTGSALGFHSIKVREFATQILEQEQSLLGPYEAVSATITRADLHQLRLDANHVSLRARIVLIRIDGMVRIGGRKGETKVWPAQRRVDPVTEVPGKILMMIGYSNSKEYFDEGLSDFETFLNSISFKKGEKWIPTGYTPAPQKPEPEVPSEPADTSVSPSTSEPEPETAPKEIPGPSADEAAN